MTLARGVLPGDQAVERVEDGRLVVYFMPRPHNESLLGALKNPSRPPRHVDIAAEREAAWTARTAEIMDVLRTDSERHRKAQP